MVARRTVMTGALAALVAGRGRAQSGRATAIRFQPPTRGAPARRVGASTRADGGIAFLEVVAPATLAHAATPAPVLYWQVGPTDLPAVLTVIADDRIDPILELDLGPPARPGLHAVALDRHGVALRPGVIHEWSVALVPDRAARSRDIVSAAPMRHVPLTAPPPGDRIDRMAAFAAAGYWYDLMQLLLGADPRRLDPADAALFARLAREAGLRAP